MSRAGSYSVPFARAKGEGKGQREGAEQLLARLFLVFLLDWFRCANDFVKRFGDVGTELRRAATQYAEEVATGAFPAEEHSF